MVHILKSMRTRRSQGVAIKEGSVADTSLENKMSNTPSKSKLTRGLTLWRIFCCPGTTFVPGHNECISYGDISKPLPIEGLTACESDSSDDVDEEVTNYIIELDGTSITVEGRTILSSKFTFRGLTIDEKLAKETNIMGVQRGGCWILHGYFSQADAAASSPELLNFTGGTVQAPEPAELTVEDCCASDHEHKFRCYYRSAGFLERQKFVRYAAPLHCFRWEHLLEYQRKAAFRQLQDINKEHVHRAREAKAGIILPRPDQHGKDNTFLPDWRNWSKMYAKEIRRAFKALKKANASWVKGENPDNPKAKPELVILDNSDEEEKTPDFKRERSDIQVVEDVVEVAEPIGVEPRGPKIGDGTENNCNEVISWSEDEQLERDKEEAKQLAEDIEYEERIAKMKRQQRDLKDKIAATEKKKSGKE
ncbi:uncharacterized protein RAG0_03384 [Rhynchosporium agropyri]|uniref:Uncharacterized protein n=1 Tax=Rhynchosporium agropyri TaxID=914238 RepID=A0A1E1K458_9HELO|nr:uncharacterized protein RAG0_03384 [Rhynchosporium agropyri]